MVRRPQPPARENAAGPAGECAELSPAPGALVNFTPRMGQRQQLGHRHLEEAESPPARFRIHVAGFDQDPDVAREPGGRLEDHVLGGYGGREEWRRIGRQVGVTNRPKVADRFPTFRCKLAAALEVIPMPTMATATLPVSMSTLLFDIARTLTDLPALTLAWF